MTVLAPNSGPIRIKPIISRTTFIIRLSTDIGSGIKLPITIAKADALPTATLLGSIKKNIAAAAIAAPKVMIEKSIKLEKNFDLVTKTPLNSSFSLFVL